MSVSAPLPRTKTRSNCALLLYDESTKSASALKLIKSQLFEKTPSEINGTTPSFQGNFRDHQKLNWARILLPHLLFIHLMISACLQTEYLIYLLSPPFHANNVGSVTSDECNQFIVGAKMSSLDLPHPHTKAVCPNKLQVHVGTVTEFCLFVIDNTNITRVCTQCTTQRSQALD